MEPSHDNDEKPLAREALSSPERQGSLDWGLPWRLQVEVVEDLHPRISTHDVVEPRILGAVLWTSA